MDVAGRHVCVCVGVSASGLGLYFIPFFFFLFHSCGFFIRPTKKPTGTAPHNLQRIQCLSIKTHLGLEYIYSTYYILANPIGLNLHRQVKSRPYTYANGYG